MPKKASHPDHDLHSDRYTDPELREKIKEQVMQGDKGGKPGQWSARKAQLVASEYEHAGGGYKQAPDEQQKSLQHWGEEHWRTSDGAKAERGGGTTRYLPDEAWNKLSKEEQAATNRKKQEGSREGRQFVANTKKATAATKEVKASEMDTQSAKKASSTRKTAASKEAARSPARKTAAGKTSAKKASATKATKTAAKKAAGKSAAKKSASAKS